MWNRGRNRNKTIYCMYKILIHIAHTLHYKLVNFSLVSAQRNANSAQYGPTEFANWSNPTEPIIRVPDRPNRSKVYSVHQFVSVPLFVSLATKIKQNNSEHQMKQFHNLHSLVYFISQNAKGSQGMWCKIYQKSGEFNITASLCILAILSI